MDSGPLDIASWRKGERARLLEERAAIPLAERRRLDERVTALLLEGFELPQGATVGFYWPMKGEFDPRIAVLRWRGLGARAALPVVAAKGQPLEYREWTPDTPTVPGVFGLPVPQSPVVVPDVVLAPPIGFDARGYRLGYGGGYFDRTLASLSPRPVAIAVAREASRIDTIHPQSWDIAMDYVVTEEGLHAAGTEGLHRVAKGSMRR